MSILSGLAGLLIALGVLVALAALVMTAFAVNAARLSRQLTGPVSTCADAARPGWRGMIGGRVEGPAITAPLSGRSVAWWQISVMQTGTQHRTVVARQRSADTVTLGDATGQIAVRVEALDRHPEWVRRWTCVTNPLNDSAGARPRELAHGEVASEPYAVEEFSLRVGQSVVLRGVRQADGTIRPPARGSRQFFAPGSPERVGANARRGSVSMAKLAALLSGVAAVLIGAGLLLR